MSGINVFVDSMTTILIRMGRLTKTGKARRPAFNSIKLFAIS